MIALAELRPIGIAVPPNLDKVIGYEGDSQFFALYWSGDDVMVTDGAATYFGEWHGFLAFKEHPAVRLFLSGYNVGSNEDQAECWLLIDRSEPAAFIATPEVALRFLKEQHPTTQDNCRDGSAIDSEISDCVLDRMIADVEAGRACVATAQSRLDEHAHEVSRMIAWLNRSEQARSASKFMAEFTGANTH